MAPLRPLRRLFRVRELEEEQARLELELALSGVRRLEQALLAAAEEDCRGRRLVVESAGSGELPDRLAGLEESRAAGRWAAALKPRLEDRALEVDALRLEFLERRVERRQAGTLIEETEARDAIEAGRRSQKGLDDWHRTRQHRERSAAEPAVALPSRDERLPEET